MIWQILTFDVIVVKMISNRKNEKTTPTKNRVMKKIDHKPQRRRLNKYSDMTQRVSNNFTSIYKQTNHIFRLSSKFINGNGGRATENTSDSFEMSIKTDCIQFPDKYIDLENYFTSQLVCIHQMMIFPMRSVRFQQLEIVNHSFIDPFALFRMDHFLFNIMEMQKELLHHPN